MVDLDIVSNQLENLQIVLKVNTEAITNLYNLLRNNGGTVSLDDIKAGIIANTNAIQSIISKLDNNIPIFNLLNDLTNYTGNVAVYDNSIWLRTGGITTIDTVGYGTMVTLSKNNFYYKRLIETYVNGDPYGVVNTYKDMDELTFTPNTYKRILVKSDEVYSKDNQWYNVWASQDGIMHSDKVITNSEK